MSELRRSQRVHFEGGNGFQLAGIIDEPVNPPRAWVLFTHCFTCTKDIKLIVRISRGLAERGYGVLRYDLTGLGHSHGDFSKTNFSTNQNDVLAAVAYLAQTHQAPEFLVGHSFGGAVSLSVAQQIPSVRGVASLAAPSDTHHLASLLQRMSSEIVDVGHGHVTIGGVSHRIERQMLENFRQTELPEIVSQLMKPVLLVHSPDDETLNYSHALRLYQFLTERSSVGLPPAPTTLMCLAGADHLFTKNVADLTFVADVVAGWFARQIVDPQV